MSVSPEVAAGTPPRPSPLRRLHALAGVGPLGAFLLLHLGLMHTAVRGRTAFEGTTAGLQSLPLLGLLEALFVFLPLGFHAGYGLYLLATTRGAPLRHGFPADWYAALHRATGVVTLVFLGVHLWHFRVPLGRHTLSPATLYPALESLLGTPTVYAGYLLGLSATVYHFAYGLWRAGITWGLVVEPRARRRSALACAVLGFALWGVGADTLVHFFARCGGVVPWPSQRVTEACRGADLSRSLPVSPRRTESPA